MSTVTDVSTHIFKKRALRQAKYFNLDRSPGPFSVVRSGGRLRRWNVRYTRTDG